MAVNNFVAGEVLDVLKLNQLVAQVNTNETNEAATNVIADNGLTLATTTNTNLSGKRVEEAVNLWSGDSYLNGSSNYNLWSSSLHQTWDVVRLYVAYDTRSVNGTGGHCFEIPCGPSYDFNEADNTGDSTLCTTYDTTYRRVNITTNGINVYNGNGAGWYLTKVVGIKYKYL
jgi:hypothetical protein